MIVVQGSRKEPFYDLGGCHAGNSEPAESGFTVNGIGAVDSPYLIGSMKV